MKNNPLDVCSDYLTGSLALTSATGLSQPLLLGHRVQPRSNHPVPVGGRLHL